MKRRCRSPIDQDESCPLLQMTARGCGNFTSEPMICCWVSRRLCAGNISFASTTSTLTILTLALASRLVLTPSLTAKLGPNGGAAKLLVRIQLITPEREFEMPELLLADNTEARSNLLSSFRTKKKRHNSSCADDIYFRKSKPVTCQASEADGLVDVSTAEKSALTTVIPELCCAMRSVV